MATEVGLDVDDRMLSRLFLIERESAFLREFHESFQLKYNRTFPKRNTVCADVVLENPRLRFDFLVGNPPWVNFNDLSYAYTERLKSAFVANGMVEDNQLLLENSNIESYLKSLNVEGSCNWAQPGRIKRFLQFTPEARQEAFEF